MKLVHFCEPVEKILIELTDEERAEILDVARRGVRRCRDAMVKLRFTDPQHSTEMRRQLEETANMWESLAVSTEPGRPEPSELREVQSPQLSAPLSEIERTFEKQ